MLFDAIRRWRRARVLASAAIPDALWDAAVAALPLLAIYHPAELVRLRAEVVLFLNAKSIVGAGGHQVTPLQRVIIAIQACVLILNLDHDWYDDFESVIVYPDQFEPGWEYEDAAGVVHRQQGPLAGEAMSRGPVMLSWPDVAAGADWTAAGMNLVIHEFAHKLDMRSGEADGCPPLPRGMSAQRWKATFDAAYAHFSARVQLGRRTLIDPYAAEHPAEFFAVLAEVFFADPRCLRNEYRALYELFAEFFGQNPAARIEGSARGVGG
jgi:Mlc titration factor MtfA (ptsG expression regulator)